MHCLPQRGLQGVQSIRSPTRRRELVPISEARVEGEEDRQVAEERGNLSEEGQEGVAAVAARRGKDG